MKARSCLSHSCWRSIRGNRLQNNLSVCTLYWCTVNKSFSCLSECQKTIFRHDCERNDNREHGLVLYLRVYELCSTCQSRFPYFLRVLESQNVCLFLVVCVCCLVGAEPDREGHPRAQHLCSLAQLLSTRKPWSGDEVSLYKHKHHSNCEIPLQHRRLYNLHFLMMINRTCSLISNKHYDHIILTDCIGLPHTNSNSSWACIKCTASFTGFSENQKKKRIRRWQVANFHNLMTQVKHI